MIYQHPADVSFRSVRVSFSCGCRARQILLSAVDRIQSKSPAANSRSTYRICRFPKQRAQSKRDNLFLTIHIFCIYSNAAHSRLIAALTLLRNSVSSCSSAASAPRRSTDSGYPYRVPIQRTHPDTFPCIGSLYGYPAVANAAVLRRLRPSRAQLSAVTGVYVGGGVWIWIPSRVPPLACLFPLGSPTSCFASGSPFGSVVADSTTVASGWPLRVSW